MRVPKHHWPITALLIASMGRLCGYAVAQDLDLAPCWRGQQGSTYQQWQFSTSANPSPPELQTNAYGTAEAVITVGQFGSGWQQQLPGLGTRTGYWDLGRTGTVALTIANRPSAPATATKDIWVQVVQWHDGVIFSEYATVAIPGATLLGGERRAVESSGFGSWMVDQTRWRLSPHAASEIVQVTGASNGSLVDQVTADTRSADSFCPSNLVLLADQDQCSKSNVTWTLPAPDNCVVSNLTCNPPPGSSFPVGRTSVTCAAADATGASASCSFTVTVQDTTALTLSIQRLNLNTNVVQICWPVSCSQPTLEWSTNVADRMSWTPVGGTVQITNNQNCLMLEARESLRWFRLRVS